MDGTALMIIGAALAGVAFGIAVGWLVGFDRRRIEHWQHRQQIEELDQTAIDTETLTRALRHSQKRLAGLEITVPELETRLQERNRRVAKLRDQVLDRESTIDSLRSRLYVARLSATLLEDELEQLRHQSNSDETTATNSITISVGGGLEIETSPSGRELS